MSQSGVMSVFLYANDAKSQPPGWSQHVNFYVTLVNQRDEKHNVMGALTSHTFKASARGSFGNKQVLESTVATDIRSMTPSMGYIVNDTLVIQCDMTNVSTAAAAPTPAAAAPPRETRIVDADTAAAAVIAAAYPGVFLPAAAAAITSANSGAVSGAAPRVAVPAGMYPTGAGGLLYLPAGALANY